MQARDPGRNCKSSDCKRGCCGCSLQITATASPSRCDCVGPESWQPLQEQLRLRLPLATDPGHCCLLPPLLSASPPRIAPPPRRQLREERDSGEGGTRRPPRAWRVGEKPNPVGEASVCEVHPQAPQHKLWAPPWLGGKRAPGIHPSWLLRFLDAEGVCHDPTECTKDKLIIILAGPLTHSHRFVLAPLFPDAASWTEGCREFVLRAARHTRFRLCVCVCVDVP